MSAVIERGNDASGVERVLRSLPRWFGIEEAIQTYVARAATEESYLALAPGGRTIGVALLKRHYAESAELTLLAVHADHRSTGIGRALVAASERALRDDGCRFLEVHTVGESFPHEGYAATRAFYRAVGFAPLHEVGGLDWDGPTLIMIKAL